MINVIEITDFNRPFMEGDGLQIVRFCAEWSGPCQIMGPLYTEISSLYRNSATFYKIDIDKVPLLKKEFGVTDLPTMLFFRRGLIIDYITGLISRDALIERLDKVIE